MKKTVRLMISFVLAAVLAVACAIPAMGLSTGDGTPRIGAPDEENFDTVYYISDNPESKAYQQAILDSNAVSNCILKQYEPSKFWDEVTLLLNGGEFFADIRDAYVIFEMESGFKREIVESGETPTEISLLDSLFQTLKQRGCKIMFICGTDEMCFRVNNYNSFLDYVDIHVNTDIWQLFIGNVFYIASEACSAEYQFYDTTFILDASLSKNMETQREENTFYQSILRTYLRPAYYSWVAAHPGGSTIEFLSDTNVKLFCHTGGKTFYDVLGDEYIHTEDQEFLNTIANDHIYAIGTTWSGESSAQEWIRLMLGIRNDYRINFPIYVCNDNCVYCTEYEATDVYLSGWVTGTTDVIIDFVSGADMTPYDNYFGRCDVTHKPLLQGADGWMRDPGEIFKVPGWYIYIDSETYKYFFDPDKL